MKGIIYELQVALSTLDWTHSMWTTIEEVFIPEKQICFNSKGYAFKTDEKRYEPHKVEEGDKFPKQPSPKKLKEVDLDPQDVMKIEGLVNTRITANEVSKKLFDVEPYKDDEE